MSSLGLLAWILLGLALQLGLFLGISFWQHWQSYRRLELAQEQGASVGAPAGGPVETAPAWTGFRAFTVARRVLEDRAGQVCSLYLEPADRRPLPPFRPGQFLTFRLDVPRPDGSGTEPIVRCYSLSCASQPDGYRVSVKRVPAPPGSVHPPGRASNHCHDDLTVGSTLMARAPAGHFHLAPDGTPVVLIAGGIGITPVLSMLEWSQVHEPGREVWLFYGVRNGAEAAFSARLRELAAANPNVRLRRCYSAPLPGDVPGEDFDHRGRIDVALLRMELPLKPYHYYVCGPGPMLQTLVPALEGWGVPAARIHYEAFGPASITRAATRAVDAAAEIPVVFARSGKPAAWSRRAGSLLELAEAQAIDLPSGCRAGGCGTCQTTIRSGEVSYTQTPDYDPEPGTCLPCVCIPKSALTLEA